MNQIEEICRRAILSVDPCLGIRNNLILDKDRFIVGEHTLDIHKVKNIFVIGFGKASIPMAESVEEILGNRVNKGAVISKQIINNRLKKIICLKGDHPIPGENSVVSTKKVIDIIKDLEPDDLVICLISGGGSALFTWPKDEIGLQGIQTITESLLRSGASIEEINSVRKCIDRIKGGGLAMMMQPAIGISLILSDVLGDDIDMIASGPTAVDPTRFEKGFSVLEKYQNVDSLENELVVKVRKLIEKDFDRSLRLDSIKELDYLNVIIGSLSMALIAAEDSARKLGYQTRIISDHVTGEAREIGKNMGIILREAAKTKGSEDPPICLIAGGETTVTVRGQGKGGRNQELALGAAIELNGCDNCILVSMATDGEDSTMDAAGAIVTGKTIHNGINNGLDAEVFLKNNDSYHYFLQAGGLLRTGPTRTNVNDLILMFVL